jgi:hypothetical protein
MNPQPDPSVGNFFAFIIICLTIFYTYKAYIEGKSITLNQLDKFVIGYVEDYTYIEKPKETKIRSAKSNRVKSVSAPKQVAVKKPKKQDNPIICQPTKNTTTSTTTTQPPKPERDEQLYNDCISSLVALGYKKMEAKNKTKQIFDEHNITSIQEFIKFVTIKTIDFS